MAAEDYFDFDAYWERDDAPEDDPRTPVVCRYCGSADVEWIHTGVRWRLFDNEARKPHCCDRRDDNDFEVLP